jgi:hypothetical protein
MSISPSEFVPFSEIPAEFHVAFDEVATVVEAESFLGLLDSGEGSVLDALLRARA